jgi:hypothetical protein
MFDDVTVKAGDGTQMLSKGTATKGDGILKVTGKVESRLQFKPGESYSIVGSPDLKVKGDFIDSIGLDHRFKID